MTRRNSPRRPISKYLPEFNHDSHAKITLRQLLSHTSGIVGNQMVTTSIADNVATLAKQPLGHEPGARWTYGPGITVAARVMEVVAGIPYDQFLRERIFEPLGMTSATFKPNDQELARVAKIYNKAADKLQVTDNLFLGPLEKRVPNPSGGLYATAGDVAKFYQMLLHGGELNGKRILSKEMVAEMTRPQTGDLTAGFVPGSKWGLGIGLVGDPTASPPPAHRHLRPWRPVRHPSLGRSDHTDHSHPSHSAPRPHQCRRLRLPQGVPPVSRQRDREVTSQRNAIVAAYSTFSSPQENSSTSPRQASTYFFPTAAVFSALSSIASSAARSRYWPFNTTPRIAFVWRISSSGFPSSITKSARWVGLTSPNSPLDPYSAPARWSPTAAPPKAKAPPRREVPAHRED